MYFRQVLNHATACASYLFGCKSRGRFAVVDPHTDLVDEYLELAARAGVPIVAVLETHVHADHVSGLRVLDRSVTERLLALPDDVLVGPTHFAGSVCGRGLSSTPISTIGFERRFNRAGRSLGALR